jgi:hypothetical protein
MPLCRFSGSFSNSIIFLGCFVKRKLKARESQGIFGISAFNGSSDIGEQHFRNLDPFTVIPLGKPSDLPVDSQSLTDPGKN